MRGRIDVEKARKRIQANQEAQAQKRMEFKNKRREMREQAKRSRKQRVQHAKKVRNKHGLTDAKQVLALADKNEDKVIDWKEAEAFMKSMNKKSTEREFNSVDSNKDGTLDLDELTKAMTSLFQTNTDRQTHAKKMRKKHGLVQAKTKTQKHGGRKLAHATPIRRPLRSNRGTPRKQRRAPRSPLGKTHMNK